jgi:hypothetical protein
MRINYNYPLGKQTIRQPKAELEITRNSSQMSVKTDPIKVRIDQTQSFESMNRYKPVRFSEKTAAEAKDVVMDTIAQIGDDSFAMVRSRGEAHVDICKRKMGEYALETITAFIPVAPHISWEGGTPTKVDFTPFRMDYNWRVHPRPEVDYEPGKFNLNVAQWNKVEIAYTGTYDDIISIGSHLRQKI